MIEKKEDKTNDEKKLPREKSVFLLAILSSITFGIYSSIWYIKRADELNNIGTEKKLSKKIGIFLIFLSIAIILININNLFMKIQGIIIEVLISIIIIIYIGLSLFLAFRTRTIINEAWKDKGVNRKVSWFFTLIFNLFYLQYEINRTINNKEEEKRTGPWVCLISLLISILLIPILLAGAIVLFFKKVIFSNMIADISVNG